MNKRKIRDSLRLLGAIVFSWLYIPHFVMYAMVGKKMINSDLDAIRAQSGFNYFLIGSCCWTCSIIIGIIGCCFIIELEL